MGQWSCSLNTWYLWLLCFLDGLQFAVYLSKIQYMLNSLSFLIFFLWLPHPCWLSGKVKVMFLVQNFNSLKASVMLFALYISMKHNSNANNHLKTMAIYFIHKKFSHWILGIIIVPLGLSQKVQGASWVYKGRVVSLSQWQMLWKKNHNTAP